jgi:ABC-type Fe3+/spermidine/putrescine transport system ATPase subunit
MRPAIEISDLELGYRDETVLSGVSLEVGDGETVAVVGPSGTGKSTLLRAVLGLATPRRGVIRIRGREVSANGRSLVPPEERHLAVVFQDLALWPHMTVESQLDFVLASRGVGRVERRARAAGMLEKVGLASRKSALPGELSGGEQQRVALARALVQEPAALLLDEPFTSLDVALKAELIELLGSLLREKRLPALLVAHDPLEALALADRIVVLESGRVSASGSFEELRGQAPRSRFLAAFVDAAAHARPHDLEAAAWGSRPGHR